MLTTDSICTLLRKKYPFFDKTIIEKAYSMAIIYLRSHNRESDINRVLNVSQRVAELGFGAEAAAAAILTDWDGNREMARLSIGAPAMTIVEEYQRLCRRLAEWDSVGESEFGEYRQWANDSPRLRVAFLIHTLETESQFNSARSGGNEDRSRIAAYVTTHLLPIASAEGMGFLVRMLEDICFDAEQQRNHRLIKQSYKNLLRQNSYYSDVSALLEQLFVKGMAGDGCFESIETEELQPKEIFDSFMLCRSDIETELDDFMSKTNVRMCDIFLLVADNRKTTVFEAFERFFVCYDSYLLPKGYAVIGIRNSDLGELPYIVLQDRFKSCYRVYILTKSDYARRRFGITSAGDEFAAQEKTERSGEGESQIKVRDSRSMIWIISQGTTVLDFAFMNGEQEGINFAGATVSGKLVPPCYVLREGDWVNLVTADTPQATLDWFRVLRSSSAKDCLIRYFKSLQNQEE